MKRVAFSLLLAGAISFTGYAQQSVSIGTDQINSNAVLWLQGNGSQGLILPVVTNRTSVTATKGMIVFDDSDKKVYYNSGTAWVEVGGGGSGVAQTLSLSGNTLSISSGNSVQIAGTAPTVAGQLLQWNGTQWTTSNAAAPTSGQVLKWNGTSWAPGTDNTGGASVILANGQLLTGNGAANTASTITGDVTLSGAALTISNNSVNSAKIADGTILGADLNPMSATNGQVLKFNGTSWGPAVDNVGGGATPTLSNGQILIGDGTSNAAASLSGDATLNGGTLTIANNAINGAKIADGSVSSAEIEDATIIANDLNSMGATNGQVLQFNGTIWNPATLAGGSGTVTNVSGTGPISVVTQTTTPVISIAQANGTTNGFITSTDWAAFNAKLGVAATTGGDLSGTVVSPTVVGIQGRSVTNTVPTNGQILKFNGTSWAPASDDVGGGATPTLSNGQILIGDGSSNSGVALSGDATLSAGALTIANNAINSTKIADGSIANVDVNAAAAIAGSKINPNFGAQSISTTGSTSTAQLIVSNEIRLGANPGTVGQVLTSAGPGTVPTWSASGGAGTVTNVSGTGPIMVATPTTTPVISISQANGSTPGFVTAADWTTFNTKLGTGTAAGGDLGGTFPNPTVNRIRGVNVVATAPVVNQVLQFNGTDWAPTNLPPTATDQTTQTGVLLGNGTTITGSTAGAGVKGILGSNNNTINWITGTADQLLGTNAIGDLQFTDKSNFMSSSLNAGEIFVGNASNVATGVAVSGDATMSSAGTLTVANNAINSAKIADGSIADADVNAAAAIAGTKVNPNFGAQNITTTGTINTGGLSTTSTNIFGALAGAGNRVLITANDGTLDAVNNAAGVLTNDGSGGLSWAASNAWGLTGNAGTNPVTNFVGTTDAVNLFFRTNNTNRMLVTGIGNVAIGANSIPNLAGGLPATFYVLGTNPTAGHFQSNSTIGTWVNLNNTSAGGNEYNLISTGSTNGEGPGRLLLHDAGLGSSVLTLFSGNVGINNNTPTEKLDITGNVRFSGALLPNNLPGTAGQVLTSAGPGVAPTWAAGGGGSLQSAYDGGNAITLAGATPVAISGTNSQSSLLINDGRIEVVDVADDDDAWYISTSGTSWLFGANNLVHSGGFAIGVSGNMLSAPFFIDPVNENIGIGGELAPSSTLDVAGDVEFSGALLPNNLPGTAGDILTSAGAGLPPTWTSPSGSTLITNPGTNNLFAGVGAGAVNTAINGAFFGAGAGQGNTTGAENTFIGRLAGQGNTTGGFNTYVGKDAGRNTTTGGNNTFLGFQSGLNSAGTNGSTLLGSAAGTNTTGQLNTFIGRLSGGTNTTGFNNTLLGSNSDVGAVGLFNATAIGANAFVNQNNTVILGSINGVNGASANARVGIGTSTPRSVLELRSGNLTLSGSAGSPADAVDIDFMRADNTNLIAKIWTDPSSNTLWMSTHPTNPSSNKNFTLDPSGNLGIGTTSILAKLQVDENSTGYVARFNNGSSSGADGIIVKAGPATPTTGTFFVLFQDGVNSFSQGSIQATGSGGVSFNTTSDRRLKQDISDIQNGLELLQLIQPRRFAYKANPDYFQSGFIAQELQPIIPEAVSGNPDSDVNENPMTIDYSKLTPVLAASIKELHELVLDQAAKIESLQKENELLKTKKESLESKVSTIEEQQQELAKSLDEIKRLLGTQAKK